MSTTTEATGASDATDGQDGVVRPSTAADATIAGRRSPWWSGPAWYPFGIGVVVLAALGVRLMNVLAWRPTCREDIVAVIEGQGNAGFTPQGDATNCFGVWGDAGYYYIQGRMIARGHWFIDSYGWFASSGERFRPSSGNPPLFSMFLGLLSALGITSATGMRIATSIVGTIGVLLIVTLVRKLAGPRAAIVAGVIAAVYPMLWINDGMLLSETLYVPMVLLALHGAYRFWEAPSNRSALVFGFAMSLAALTRGEGFILLGVMVLPLLYGMRSHAWRERVRWLCLTYAVGVLMLAPWVIYNNVTFEEPVWMTSSTGAVLSSTNCDITYYGESIGYYGNCFDEYVAKGLLIGKVAGCDQAAVDAAFDPKGSDAAKCWPNDPNIDESQRDKFGRQIAIDYMLSHKRRLPIVAAARVGRMWDVYAPDLGRDDEPFGQNVRFNWQVEGRGKRSSEAGFLMFFALWPFALAGGIWLVRRRIPVSPLLSMAIVITVTSAFTFGITRYRVPVDVMMVVFGAAGIEWIIQRWWPRQDVGSLLRRCEPRAGGRRSFDATSGLVGTTGLAASSTTREGGPHDAI